MKNFERTVVNFPWVGLIVLICFIFWELLSSQSQVMAQEAETKSENPWMDTVVVSVTRTPETVRDLPISPIIIDEETISKRPDAVLGDLLEEQGIMIDRQYRLGGQVSLRGMSGNISGSDVQSDVLMLFNGHRVGRANMLRFPSKNIERIEVLRGPAALQFGSAAMGGVVNVITKQGEGPVSAFVQAGIGSWSMYNDSVGVSGAHNGFDYSVGFFQMAQHSDYKTGDGQTYLGTTIGLKVDSSANFGYTFNDKHRIGLIYNIVEVDDYGFTGSIYDMATHAVGAGGRRAVEANYEHKTSGYSNFLDLNYTGSLESDWLSWKAKYFIGKDVQSEGYNVNIPLRNSIQGAQAQISGYFQPVNTTLTLGFDWTSYDFSTESSNLGHYTYDDYGGYLMVTTKLFNDRFVVSGGVRYNSYQTGTEFYNGINKSGNELTPSLGVSFQATDWLKLRSNFAKGYRAPAANEMFGQGGTRPGRYSVNLPATPYRPAVNLTSVWLTHNFDLEPQKSDSIEGGFDIEYQGIQASLTAFYSKFYDKIETVETPFPTYVFANDPDRFLYPTRNTYNNRNVGFPDPSNPTSAYVATSKYVNIGNATISGLEWSLKWDMGKFFGWEFSIAPYSRGTYIGKSRYDSGTEIGLRLRKVPRWYSSNGVEINVPRYNLWVDLNILSKSSQRITDMMMFDSHVTERQSGWTIANLRFKKELLDFASHPGKLSVEGEVTNLTDEYYEVFPLYPLPGRTFFLSMRYDYN
jgi:vitamin B12 transporter